MRIRNRHSSASSRVWLGCALATLLAIGALSVHGTAVAGPESATDSQIQKWIDDLGADDFRTREQASEQLAALGTRAEPLLKKAAKDSSSLEVRWRAEQLLRASKKGPTTNTSPERKVIPVQPKRPNPAPRTSETEDESENASPFKRKRNNPLGQPNMDDSFRKRMEELKRQLERFSGGANGGDLGLEDLDRAIEDMQKRWPEIMRRSMDETMERLNSMLDGQGIDPNSIFGSFGTSAPRVVSVRGLTLRKIAPSKYELQVRNVDQPTTPAETYTGSSLSDILLRHQELANHPQMNALKQRIAARQRGAWPGFSGMPRVRIHRGQPGSVSIQIQSGGVEIKEDANGATVRIRERDKDGNEKVKEYTGNSIEDIKKEHPEIASRLGGTTFEIRPPQMFGPSAGSQWLREWRNRSARQRGPTTGAHPRRARLGAQVTRPLPALASQLGLRQGAGAIVVHVLPGTPAADMGLAKHDIIVSVNGKSVESHAHLGGLVAPHLAPGKSLTLEIIRGGNRMTVSR